MSSEEQEMIWSCGSGDALGDAAGTAAADGAGAAGALELECALNATVKIRTMIASGANATAENRFAGSFIGDSPQDLD
jgi:hypothetical protein